MSQVAIISFDLHCAGNIIFSFGANTCSYLSQKNFLCADKSKF